MSVPVLAQFQPDQEDVTSAVQALPHIKDYLDSHANQIMVRLVVDDGEETLTVPRTVVELLSRILTHMAAGQGVSVVPTNAELTTQQAAEMLNVSRPFLIGLLDAGEIRYRKVGKHRRIQAASLLKYLHSDDQQRLKVADELSALAQQMGVT